MICECCEQAVNKLVIYRGVEMCVVCRDHAITDRESIGTNREEFDGKYDPMSEIDYEY